MPPLSAAQLDAFLDAFSPEVAKSARRALAKVRKLVPGAIELVYDNYNALAIAFAPTEKAGDAILSVAVYPRYASLFLVGGQKLADPTKRLQGSGATMRHIVLDPPTVLDEPDVKALVAAAVARAKVPLDPKQKRRLVIKSVSKKQRPRRPTAKV